MQRAAGLVEKDCIIGVYCEIQSRFDTAYSLSPLTNKGKSPFYKEDVEISGI